MGGPKALMKAVLGEPWVVAAARVLQAGGCDAVHVAVGAAHDEVAAVLEPIEVGVIVVPSWSDGLAATLRASLTAIADSHFDADADAVMLHLVDLPDVGADVVRRLLARADPEVLARATYSGRPGHPVLVGRRHWAALEKELAGDQGANSYLARHGAVGVECGDLAGGCDADSPADLDRLRAAAQII